MTERKSSTVPAGLPPAGVLFLGLGSFSDEAVIFASDGKPESWWLRKAQRRADRLLEVVELHFPNGRVVNVCPRWDDPLVRKRIDRLALSLSSDRRPVEVFIGDAPETVELPPKVSGDMFP
ncbi:hypothetical protein [Acidithiobacillus caldus]|uniref:Uncharacterized protein n=2 Tax=Acidithiobacillus caldus TaxID=33059 RepID=A0A1E7YP96_9PROT|nr:hypothetical protein [Acidithiobacillus caldus]OFC36899.1 hypothetical protein BAE27_05070 [Acidithiobacillus caldus]OFC41286.1 hypothetical protein BAE29_03300 [Acidithiobacillus caldus]